jgi:GNAT superfamily N-acetyltransferase
MQPDAIRRDVEDHHMQVEIIKTNLEAIKEFRLLFLHENHFQFVHDKCHLYGWADTWLILLDARPAGYGSVWGTDRREDRDTLFEFFLLPPFRMEGSLVFRQLLSVTGVRFIECQTNDPLLTSMLYEFATDIRAEAILFEDHFQTRLSTSGVVFSRETDKDEGANAGGYVLLKDGEAVASGGFMLNYNMPYADIYMEVKEHARRKGFGSIMVQELKREVYLRRRVPAARCNIRNLASKATLLKAGFTVCGTWLKGNAG